MKAIDAVLPAADGIACFNRMYLDVTTQVDDQVEQGLFGDPGFVAHLDVVFANLYFSAVDSLTTTPNDPPIAWKPLLTVAIDTWDRADPVRPCRHERPHQPRSPAGRGDDVQRPVDRSGRRLPPRRLPEGRRAARRVRAGHPPIVRGPEELAADRHVAAVATLVSNWSMNTARDVAWNESMALWDIRDHPHATALLTSALGHTVAMVSRALLCRPLNPMSRLFNWPRAGVPISPRRRIRRRRRSGRPDQRWIAPGR